ncbi:hypothetical protein K435DRAFT_808046 [Dendrothele bispora CBS 962.96]|uniref:Uncharacterized protein n=1 Tax=Dendrothele bispora (strain CBS 962.96) TaxID=1314807 RepID=A0A4S8L2Q5_DENBC|nr:hypothetical protein K435DRAFT_808046 [Dendrothele bispora CBS 962.96]
MSPNHQPLSCTVKMIPVKFLYDLAEKHSASVAEAQRWDQMEQSLYVDSIWNHYPINHLVFRIVEGGSGTKMVYRRAYTICSPLGQQSWYDSRPGLSVTDWVLTQSERAAFEDMSVPCIFLTHLSKLQAEEIVRAIRKLVRGDIFPSECIQNDGSNDIQNMLSLPKINLQLQLFSNPGVKRMRTHGLDTFRIVVTDII